MLTRTTRALLAGAVALVAIAVGHGPIAPAGAATWAPADSATVHPGVQMVTEGAQCTANFIFEGGGAVFIGYAAHCAGTGGATDTNGCEAGSLPLGTPVEILGASQPGTLAYSSWLTMDQVGETDTNTCQYNDFALVRIDDADVADVNPSIPHWGGPTGVNTSGTSAGEQVYSYGNSSLRFGVTQVSPKTGTALGTEGDGWTHPVYTASPGIPGDSGSAFLDSQGRAVGVLSTISIAPLAGSNNASDINKAVQYMHAHGGPSATLVNGTEAFDGGQVPVSLGL